MAKSILPAIGILLILLILLSGCVVKPPSSSNNGASGQQTPGPNSPYHAIVTPTNTGAVKSLINNLTYESNVTPNFAIGQIALTSPTGSSGIAIIDYNNVTKMYGTLPVSKDSNGNSWHTDGYQLIEWKDVTDVDSKYKSYLNYVINPIYIPEWDPTKDKNVELGEPCDLAGDWSTNKGTSVYMFRLDRIVVNKTGNQTLIGTWKPVNAKEGRTFVITWQYGPLNNSANYMEKITLTSDYAKFTGKNNYGDTLTGSWVGLIPSWKAELDKEKPENQAKIAVGADCYKWLGGDEWYNKV
jgi:hypothetical protein